MSIKVRAIVVVVDTAAGTVAVSNQNKGVVELHVKEGHGQRMHC